ncbi:TetR/AcrR family transcriptional regulator [Nocardia vinacea]|uniref:TetR/AcrR family transcriptional regulator n=1 Tax=Nocardia vinacea TaxID=96468 RepID=A0ABZ1YT20_9NOCA|nr:TetR/AcrR family transcriptional regulator [Nocardia vinacea]
MGRQSRAALQQRNRDRVLAAAKAEFAERGFRGATVDDIAERADLTRGAVYSNFAGKRALYLAVLAAEAEGAPELLDGRPARTPVAAIGRFARTWVDRLPGSANYPVAGVSQLHSPMLAHDLIPELVVDECLRGSFVQLIKLDAILLGLALAGLDGSGGSVLPGRWLGIAESVITLLYGATQLSFVAPEFVDRAKVIAACEQMVHHRIDDTTRATADTVAVAGVDEPWTPPPCRDLVHTVAADLSGVNVVAVLGMNKLGAVADILRDQPSGGRTTIAMATADGTEVAQLARLAVSDISRSLRAAFPCPAVPGMQVVLDESGKLARACGVDIVDDDTESAVYIDGEQIVARAKGAGACQALAKTFGTLEDLRSVRSR